MTASSIEDPNWLVRMLRSTELCTAYFSVSICRFLLEIPGLFVDWLLKIACRCKDVKYVLVRPELISQRGNTVFIYRCSGQIYIFSLPFKCKKISVK